MQSTTDHDALGSDPLTELPKAVQVVCGRLDAWGLWYQLSENPPASGCADAANKRRRLGSVGIPLHDELKSHVGTFTDDQGTRRFVAVHCRGHLQRDETTLTKLVGHVVERLDPERMAETFGIEYGTVNPVILSEFSQVTQVFDRSLLRQYPTPHTMMTNAGDHRFAIEFEPRALIESIPGAVVADVAVGADYESLPTIGILTGNGPESGLLLCELVLQEIRSRSAASFAGDTGFPRIEISSRPDMGLSMELSNRAPSVRRSVEAGVSSLCDQGADLIALACNTTQYFASEIRSICSTRGARFVSMAEATQNSLLAAGLSEFDLIGIGPVVDLEQWSGFAALGSAFKIHIPSPETLARVDELAFEIKRQPRSGRAVAQLGHLIRNSCQSSTVLIALTELSVVLSRHPKVEQKAGRTLLDTLKILATALADEFLAARHRLEGKI